jgi:C-terminal peptidase prc
LRYVLLTLTAVIYIGCGTNSSSSDFKSFLSELFSTQYFWKDKISNSNNLDKYQTPQEMIDDLKYKPKDKWSIAITKEENSNFLNQKSKGFGFARSIIGGKSIVIYVRIGSPAYNAGMKRGDILLKVDGKDITLENMLDATKNLETKTKFLIYRASIDKNITIEVLSQEYKFKVTSSSIVRTPQQDEVGYLRLDSFTAEATQEIDRAFTFFKSKNIENLIIDMRYNGGGSVVTASILLDKLIKDRDEEVQFTLKWNSDYQSKNRVYRFETDKNSLNLNKIIFLTTRATASASELVINSLKPYKQSSIVIVGDRTHGKPVGMEGKTDGTYVYYLVNFVIANSNNFYNYFNGLDVTKGCKSQDDLTHQLGDSSENMLKKALSFIDNGSCN